MPELTLDASLDTERSTAVRSLLRHPLLDSGTNPDSFRLVARHRVWLEEWFETTCGWPLTVDVAGGFARLHKRAGRVDGRRPLLRTRGSADPFDRRRYQLLCLAVAELVRHPATTVGLLASAITPEAGLDTSRHGERAAFVDSLRALIAWGALRSSAGDVDAFINDAGQNALLTADTARLHRLLSSVAAPSALPESLDVEATIDQLLTEPRYSRAADAAVGTSDEERLRWLRHTLARRLLDDPVVYIEDLSPPEAEYLAHPSGRQWLRARAAEAGLELEERLEGLVAVDPEGTATDRFFPAPQGNAHQVALLLVDRLLTEADGERRPTTRSRSELRAIVIQMLDRHQNWARKHRAEGGPDLLVTDAVSLLVDMGLARWGADGAVTALPALARYRAGEPVVVSTQSLFEEEP
ncbi:MAG: TIGR02678 family protein [Acidimicrobiia bacterium]